MTGGTAVILGDVGDNFLAGDGGMAFIYDKSKEFERKLIQSQWYGKMLKQIIGEIFKKFNFRTFFRDRLIYQKIY